MKYLQTFLIIFIFSSSYAYEDLEFDLDSGSTLGVTHFEGKGKTLLLWIPSERGFGQGLEPVALDLASLDFDVWAVKLHESYMLPAGRYSLNRIDSEDLVQLVQLAQNQGYEEIFIISSSRGAQLALKLAYRWQQISTTPGLIKGLVFISPQIVRGRTELGQQAEYETISSFSNLPVYILQPQYSTRYVRIKEIARQLQQGGSQTFVHLMKGVQGGFHMRPDEDLNEQDIASRATLANTLGQAFRLLRNTKAAPFVEHPEISRSLKSAETGTITVEPGLYPYKGLKTPPALILEDLKGNTFDLTNSKGQVVLVNFWASWCGPCVKEIPSLTRLVEDMQHKPFKVVAVNIGESKQTINEFISSMVVNFDILIDKNGASVRDWKVYAYPSNFLIDKSGRIQYAYRGALKWDSPAIVDTINQLF